MRCEVWGVGFEVWGLGFGVRSLCLGFLWWEEGEGSGKKVLGRSFRVWGPYKHTVGSKSVSSKIGVVGFRVYPHGGVRPFHRKFTCLTR